MATTAPPRIESIEIPDRPAVASRAAPSPATRKRIFLCGGIAAVALLVIVMMALLWSGERHEVARAPADAPLIKAEDQPIKVAPESPGGMDVPNRDILVYGRMQGTPGDKPVVERLLPEPEQPLAPPASPPRPPHTASAPVPLPVESPLNSEQPTIEASPAAPPVAAPQPSWSPQTPTKSSAPPPAPPIKSAAGSQVAQAKIPTAPAAAAKPAQPGKPAKSSSVQLQLFSSRSAEEARSAWARLKDKNGDLLGALSPTVARADLGDRGTFYRLRAGPIADEAKARAICDSLAGRGTSCIIIPASR
jgi:outer membrane biosynthesis protein TonB